MFPPVNTKDATAVEVEVRVDRVIDRIRACGRTVTVLEAPLYGPERDQVIRQARAVLNCHFYEAARFERIREIGRAHV